MCLLFKGESLDKEDYRPTSILSHVSKIFKRIKYEQINNFMTSKFPPVLCGFRKNHNSRYCLLKMMEIWKNHLDKGDRIAIILMVLSKAFDTTNHNLLLANLETYGSSITKL